jgi:CBS domain containing-hemolysin-like protein
VTVLLPYLALLAVLLVLSAFFSGSESAMFSLDSYALEQLDEENRASDRAIRRMLDTPRRLLATILLGNEFVNITISTVGLAAIIALRTEYEWLPWWLNIVIITPLLLVFGEIAPKAIAVRTGLSWARGVALPLATFGILIAPLRAVLDQIATLILRLGGAAGEDPLPEALRETQFKALINLGEEQGVLDRDEAELIHRVFDLTDTSVSRVMTLRRDVVGLPLGASLIEILELIRDKRYARLPVYADDLSKVRGILLTKDLLRFASRGEDLGPRQLEAMLKPAYFVPPGKTCGALLQEFQDERGHMAFVLAEDGDLAGLVTMQDLLDELFEPMVTQEESLHLGPRIERLAPGVFRIPARMKISDWNKMMMPPLPVGESYNTLAGYIFYLFGRLPKKGESIRDKVWTFSVTGLEGTRLTWITAQRREGGGR